MGPAMGAGTPVCWDKRSVAWPTKCCRTWASEPSYSVAMRCCWCCVAAHPTRANGPFLAARYGGARRCRQPRSVKCWKRPASASADVFERDEKGRSEEHTSELQSRENLVCRLLLEKKDKSMQNQENTHYEKVNRRPFRIHHQLGNS